MYEFESCSLNLNYRVLVIHGKKNRGNKKNGKKKLTPFNFFMSFDF